MAHYGSISLQLSHDSRFMISSKDRYTSPDNELPACFINKNLPSLYFLSATGGAFWQ